MGIFSLNQFCQRLSESGFVDPETADDRIDRWREESRLSEDERKLADWLVSQGMLTAFQAETLLLGLQPPYVIGEWKLVELTAAGRLGNVFKAVHGGTQTVASLKVFPPGLRRDPLQLARMRREARVAVQLDHPHVVRTRSLGQDGDFLFLELEPLEGETLGNRLTREKRLSWQEAARCGAEAALGLQYLHGRRIIHRDIQPENLWIGRDGRVEVMEFGAARDALEFLEASDSGVGLSELGGGSIVGTFDYMAPEQAQDSKLADARSDLYSLGCVLYHCLTGRPPFPDTHPVRQMLRHANEPPEQIEKVAADAPPALLRIVSALLAKKPGERPAQASHVAENLRRTVEPAAVPRPAAKTRVETSPLSAVIERMGNCAVLRVATTLPGTDGEPLLKAVDDAIRTDKPRRIVIDLADVSLMTSSGLSMLIVSAQKARDAGVSLRLAAVSEGVQSILAITQLTRLLTITPSVEAALQAPETQDTPGRPSVSARKS